MSGKKLIIIGLLILAGIALCIVLGVVAIIGVAFISDGCFYRYSDNPNAQNESGIFGMENPEEVFNEIVDAVGLENNYTSVTSTGSLKANGNYTSTSAEQGSATDDPSAYGQWMNTNVAVTDGQQVDMTFSGSVSLCRAYIPRSNLQSENDTDSSGNRIKIPRVEEIVEPLYLTLDAQNEEWRNIAEIYKGDHVVVTLKPDQKASLPQTTLNDVFNGNVITANCQEGLVSYDPTCGKYSSWNQEDVFVQACQLIPECYECNIRQECSEELVGGVCNGVMETVSDMCSCFQNQVGIAPAPYLNSGKHTYPWSDNINDLQVSLERDCETEQEYIEGDYQNQQYFWYSADDATGLLYRFDSGTSASSQTALGSNYFFTPQPSASSGNDRVIFDQIYDQDDLTYLQYRLLTREGPAVVNTGGYVLGVKQTKCRRERGEAMSDSDFSDRGAIEYAISSGDSQPGSSSGQSLDVQNGEASIVADASGNLWLRIKNADADYIDSTGQYSVRFTTYIENGDFLNDILTPFLVEFKALIMGAASTIFQNMTCFNQAPEAADCQNFFNYIKGMLTLYIMGYGLMFLMGFVQISQTDIVIRVIKVGVVAGLISGRTFEFFRDEVFDFVINFSDNIIANMSGYSLFSDENSISNPLAFMAEVLTNILLNPTFSAQIMALLSMFVSGIVYFIIMIVAIGILLIVLFRSITIYLMAFMALSVLMGMAPLFLSFILFQRTKYLFDNWVKYCIRYMLEPVVLMAGIIILTQLITIFLDNILSYSVCWKCVLPFKLPFLSVDGVVPDLLNVDIFCINWFAPWGYDPQTAQVAPNLQYIAILLILVFCIWHYADFSARLVSRITNSFGTPGATGMGQALTGTLERGAQKATGLDPKSRAAMKKSFSNTVKGYGKGVQSGKATTDMLKQLKHRATKGKNDPKDYKAHKRLKKAKKASK